MKLGTIHSPETRAKISEKMRGLKRSEETRRKQSLARTAYWAKRHALAKQARQEEAVKAQLIEDLTRPLEFN